MPATPATIQATGCQPPRCTTAASIGRNTSWPVAVLAVRMPITRPRRSTNQRFTTAAASTTATKPEPVPTTTPQLSISCQVALIRVLAATTRASTASALSTVRRMPKRCMQAAANGPINP